MLYCINVLLLQVTLNLEIFARVLFSRNFAYAKFCENKILEKWGITLSFTGKGKSCPSRALLTSQVRLSTLFAKIKLSLKFPDLQYMKNSYIYFKHSIQ